MDKLKDRTYKLSELKKEDPFGTPDRYFDDFSARLQTKLETEKMVIPIQKNRFIRFLKPVIGLAASFAIIYLLVNLPLKTFMNKQIAESETQTDLYDIEFLTMVDNIDENSFFTLFNEPDNSTEFTDEDLVNYLSASLSEYEIYNETNNGE